MKWHFGKGDHQEYESGFWGDEEETGYDSDYGFWDDEEDEEYEDRDSGFWDYDEDEDDDDYYDEDEDDYEDEGPRERTLAGQAIYMAVVLACAVAIAIGLWFAADDVLSLTKPDQDVTVTITQGESLGEIASALKDSGLIRYKGLFMLYGMFSGAERKVSPGTFLLNTQFDYHALVDGLSPTSETRATVTLTFPEGYTCQQMFDMLAENGVCDLAELQNIAANYEFDYDFLENRAYGDERRLEGYMFPDTYDFYVDDDAVRVISKFLSNFESRVTAEMLAAMDDQNAAIRRAMEAEGSFDQLEIEDAMLDLDKMLTVASLIEKEAGTDSERSLIASVIYNRLTTRIHPLLQIDASVEYALGGHRERFTDEDLAVDSPYNTYRYEGLPPGPIANPGLASITAALYPQNTDYFFYALDEGGVHRFFETYMEQQDFLYGNVTPDTEIQPAAPAQEAQPAEPQTQEPQTQENGEETGQEPETPEDQP